MGTVTESLQELLHSLSHRSSSLSSDSSFVVETISGVDRRAARVVGAEVVGDVGGGVGLLSAEEYTDQKGSTRDRGHIGLLAGHLTVFSPCEVVVVALTAAIEKVLAVSCLRAEGDVGRERDKDLK